MNQPVPVAYIHRYALDKGIIKVEGGEVDGAGVLFWYVNGKTHFAPRDHWSASFEDALAAARRRRSQWLARTELEIERINNLDAEWEASK